jgi:hypothetical protein
LRRFEGDYAAALSHAGTTERLAGYKYFFQKVLTRPPTVDETPGTPLAAV